MQVADKVASKLTAADVMSPAPRTCSIYSSVLEAVLIFRDADCGAIPVVETGEAVGILTDRDVALALAEHPDLATREVGDIMTRGPAAPRVGLGLSLPLPSRGSGDSRTRLPEPSRG
jgi:CBS domain-containing protein